MSKNKSMFFLIVLLLSSMLIPHVKGDVWVSPTSFSDPDSAWTTETNVYDENLGTYSRAYANANQWTSWIYLIFPSTYSNKVRVYCAYSVSVFQSQVDVYIDGYWVNVIDNYPTISGWNNGTFTASSITQIRYRSKRVGGAGSYGSRIYEADINEVVSPPSDPNLLFGAGFNSSIPYVKLLWNHSLEDVSLFEVQNSTNGISWEFLGNTPTTNYTDFQVVNGTYRYYKVRACNYTGGAWYNSSFSNIDMEKVYFISEIGNGTPLEDYAGLFIVGLIIGLIIGIGASRS